MATLSIRLLGVLDIRLDSQLVQGFISNKAQALLIYLAATRHPCPRAALATLFWGDMDERTARRNLSKSLSNLRRLVGEHLHIERYTVTFRTEKTHWLDVAIFEQKLTSANANDWQDAVALYQDDFLAGYFVANAPDFEAWLRTERERLHRLCCDGFRRLSTHASRADDLKQAISWLQKLLQLEPTDEQAQRKLMTLFMRNGQRSAALNQYAACCAILAQELDVEPAQETVELYHKIRAGDAADLGEAITAHAAADVIASSPTTRLHSKRTPTKTMTTVVQPQHLLQLTGRETAWRRLQSAWQQTLSDKTHFCLIRGEAGIGKTRLAEELLVWAVEKEIAVARTRAYAAAGDLAYTPIVDWLRSAPLQQALATLDDVWLADLARLLPELTGDHPQPTPDDAWSSVATVGQWQRQRLFDVLTHAFHAGTQPKILLLDDLQWCDGETLAWLHYFLQASQQVYRDGQSTPPTLIIATARPEILHEGHPSLPVLTHLRSTDQMTEIALEPLDAAASVLLATRAATTTLTPTQTTALFDYTEGNPLFVIETLRTAAWQTQLGGLSKPSQTVFAAADEQASLRPPPPKIQAIIQERLAQLSPAARTLTGLAAVIGRSFRFALLQAASAEEDKQVAAGLNELWQAGIVRAHGDQRFDFSHDRIREVAYLAVGPVQRPLWHRQVAQALEALHADDLAPLSAQLAAHYERAGNTERAIKYYQQAAKIAEALFADGDAVNLLRRALDLVETLPTTRQHREQELAILLQMKEPVTVSQGFGTQELEGICTRASLLAQDLGRQRELFQALNGLRSLQSMRGQYKDAFILTSRILSLADGILGEAAPPTTEDIKLSIAAHQGYGNVLFRTGALLQARFHYDQALCKGFPNPGLSCFSAKNWWLLGYPERARQQMHQALVAAHEEGYPHEVAFVTASLARLSHFLRRMKLSKLWAAKTMALTSPYDMPFWPNFANLFLGRADAELGKNTRCIELLQTTLAQLEHNGHQAFCSYFWSLLAEAYACAQQFAQAQDALDQAMTFVERNGERFWHAELVRLRGDYHLALGAPHEDVIAHYQAAIAIAQEQQAKSLELRATISLARLWQQQGKRDAACEQLTAIYNWFSEGFKTADLRAARALLAELM